MIIEHLGHTYAAVNRLRTRVPAFVIWLDDPDKTLAEQMPYPMACPSCAGLVDLSRVKADRTFSLPNVFSTALGCRTCGSVLHFDKTPMAARPSLQWTKRYRD